MKVLLTGAGGQLGRELAATCPRDIELIACRRADLDITQRDQVESVLARHQPDLIVNTAAYTAVDRAESEPDIAFAVNGDGPRALASMAIEIGARLIHFSTDFVFNGRQASPYQPQSRTDPQSVYGASKLAGEGHVLEICDRRALVIRTAWVYSRFGGNFVDTMLRLMSERDSVSVVADQIGTPTWTRSLAELVWACGSQAEIHGLHHWTDAGVASWYDFAVAVQEEAATLELLAPSSRLIPVTTADFPTPARRPPYSVLDCTSIRRHLDLPAVHWRRQLRTMLHQMREPRED